MKLISASVQGLFGEFDHSITINPDGITFVHAMNGVGKTVFLTLIYNILRCDRHALETMRFNKVELKFDDGSKIVAENGGSGLRIGLNRNGTIVEMTSASAEGIGTPTFITSSRTVVRKGDGTLMYALDAYSEELKDWFVTAKDDSAISIEDVACPADLSDSEIDERLRDLKAKVEFMYDSGFRVNLPIGYKIQPSRYDIGKNHDGYLRLVYALEDYLSKDHQLAESIIVFQDIINSFFVGKRLQINNGRMSVVLNDGTAIPMSSLSSGETNLLIIFYRLLFQAAPDSLVIIDEPEISLHVSWQQKLGPVFNDICRLRDLEMLIATHSPQTIHDMWDRASELR